MSLSVTPIGPGFAARVSGVDITTDLGDQEFAALLGAFHTHSVLVFGDAPMNDEQQIRFSSRFGPLERTPGVNPGAGTPFARQSNLDRRTGAVIDSADRRMFYQRANMLWHADSTFKPVTSLCSVLSAREVPPEGGNTEFVSTRLAFARLPDARKRYLEPLMVEHDFIFSRNRVGFTFTPEEAASFPPVQHRLVRTNQVNGCKSLMIGAHAKSIVGWSMDESTVLLDELLADATRTEAQFSHRWRTGDVVVWDNQAVLHRATPYDTRQHRRLMQRTTISMGEVSVP